jgi:hypothetical protein
VPWTAGLIIVVSKSDLLRSALVERGEADKADVLDGFVEATWDRHVGDFDEGQNFGLLGDVSQMSRERRVVTHHIQCYDGSIIADLVDFGQASQDDFGLVAVLQQED